MRTTSSAIEQRRQLVHVLSGRDDLVVGDFRIG
jgi:hypothetical protein